MYTPTEKFYEVKDQRFLGEEEFVSRIEGEKRRGERGVLSVRPRREGIKAWRY